MFDFLEKLRLGSEGLNAHKEITSLVFENEITFVFGARQPNDWKVNINEFVTAKDCEALSSYMNMFTHILLPTMIT